jgi:hypothetical protein
MLMESVNKLISIFVNNKIISWQKILIKEKSLNQVEL